MTNDFPEKIALHQNLFSNIRYHAPISVFKIQLHNGISDV